MSNANGTIGYPQKNIEEEQGECGKLHTKCLFKVVLFGMGRKVVPPALELEFGFIQARVERYYVVYRVMFGWSCYSKCSTRTGSCTRPNDRKAFMMDGTRLPADKSDA